MGIFKLMIATAVASALLLGLMPAKALADTSATQEEVCETVTGFYGQTTTRCVVPGKDKPIVTRQGVPVTEVKETGLDTLSMNLVFGTVAIGALAFLAKNKLQA